jgi:hypothetical protein
MEKKEYRYEIDGKIYIQRPLVLGQTSQMIETFADINIPSDVDTIGIIKLLGDKLPDALAVVLREENIALKDKDISTLAEILRESMSIQTAMEVIDNFFGLNPIASVFEKLTGMMAQILPLKTTKPTGSKKSSSPSHEEISQKENKSSGDTHSKNASPGSKSADDGESSGKE